MLVKRFNIRKKRLSEKSDTIRIRK